jgi:rhodanese-related sulfurtransferase
MNVLPTLHRLIATDVDELTEKVHSLAWQIDYIQLERGLLQAEILNCQWPDIQLIRVQYSRAIRSLGISPSGKVAIAHWQNLPESAFLLDVRHPQELAVEQAAGVVNIPLPELRSRLGELPKDREICVVCRSGQRAYYATRILPQNGFRVRNVSGGMMAHSVFLREETVAGTLY